MHEEGVKLAIYSRLPEIQGDCISNVIVRVLCTSYKHRHFKYSVLDKYI